MECFKEEEQNKQKYVLTRKRKSIVKTEEVLRGLKSEKKGKIIRFSWPRSKNQFKNLSALIWYGSAFRTVDGVDEITGIDLYVPL